MKLVVKLAAMLTVLSLMVCGFAGCSNLLPTEEDIMPPPISKPEEASYKTEVVAYGDIQDTKYCVGAVEVPHSFLSDECSHGNLKQQADSFHNKI